MLALDKLIVRLRHLHDDCGMTWESICQLPDFWGISLSVLHAIYKYEREPKDPATRRQLGLPDLVPTCGQCWRLTERKLRRYKRSRPKRIQDYPLAMLRAALVNREEYL